MVKAFLNRDNFVGPLGGPIDASYASHGFIRS